MNRAVSIAELVARGSLVVNDGYRTKANELGDAGIPILRVAEIGNGTITPTSGDPIREEYRKAIGAKLSQNGDVLLTTKGTVGRRAIVPVSAAGMAYSPQLCFFRVTDHSIDSRWLYYWLGGSEFWTQATGVSTQTDMAPYISLRDLRAISVSLPSRGAQRVIAETLGALDDKIESNRRAVGLIEALLMLEFQRVISTGEVVKAPLSELVSIVKGVSYKSVDLRPSRTSLVTLKSFDRNGGYKANGLKPYAGPYRPHQVVEPGELVIAQTDVTQGAEVVGRAVRVPADPSADTLVASLDLVIVRPLGEMTLEYLQGIVTDEAFREFCRSRTSGTTVLHLASNAISTYDAPLVSADAQHEYTRFARPLIQRADSLNREIERLAEARDTLLPELLAGRIRIGLAAEVLV